MKKPSFKPIAMRCNQEQFERVRSKLSGWMFDYAIVSLEYPYLTNYLQHGNQIATCTDFYAKNNKERHELHETWNEKIFLEACGIETIPTLEEVKEYFKDAETISPLSESYNLEKYTPTLNIVEYCSETKAYYSHCEEINTDCELWNKKKGYAKILTYKEPKEETFVISREQLENIVLTDDIRIIVQVKEWFPKAFEHGKKELVAGKWYKYPNYQKFNLCITEVDEKTKTVKGYGFGVDGLWMDNAKNDIWDFQELELCIEMPQEEVEEALNKEAVKRGYIDGVYIEDLYHDTKEWFKCNGNEFEYENIPFGALKGKNGLRDKVGNVIFCEGIWASLKTITKQEAEQKLNCKII